jgi:hypothetical protein
MAFDFAAAKARVHRIVHDTLAVDATYEDDVVTVPVPLRVRWHDKLAATGDLNGDGYPVSIDTIDRVFFDVAELVVKNVTITRGGIVKFTAGYFAGLVLVIDTRDPKSDAAREIWHASRDNGRFNP